MTETFTGEVHPVADLFPMLADEELADLAEDIAARGLLQPIVLDPDGRLLDGRNRLAACRKAGIEPTFVTFDGVDPGGYALTVNITRRHLTTGARAVLAEQARRLNGTDQRRIAADTDLYQARIAEAAVVLDWAPALAPAVIAGATPLSRAVEDAREAKRDAEELDAKLARLRVHAADLAVLVDEERMGVDDAIAALNERERVAAEEAEARSAEERAQRAVEADACQSWTRELAETVAWIERFVAQQTDEYLAWFGDPDTPGFDAGHGITNNRIDQAADSLRRLTSTFGATR